MHFLAVLLGARPTAIVSSWQGFVVQRCLRPLVAQGALPLVVLWAMASGCVTRQNEGESASVKESAASPKAGHATKVAAKDDKRKLAAEKERAAELDGVVDTDSADDEEASGAFDEKVPQGAAAKPGRSSSKGKQSLLPPAPKLTAQNQAAQPPVRSASKPGKKASVATATAAQAAKVAPAAAQAAKPGDQVKVESAKKLENAAATPKATLTASQLRALTVTASALNIRSQPDIKSKIVGRLMRGTKLPVAIEGRWAKIGENQYVLAKFLKPGL